MADLLDRGRALYAEYRHLVNYAIIGAGASFIDVALFAVLFNIFDFPALAAHSVSVPVSVVYSFTLNAFLNFGTTDRLLRRFVSFAVVAAIGFAFGAAVIWVVHDLLGINGNLAKLASLPVVFIVQYVLNTRTSFRPTEPALATASR
ncbi:MAG: GtrA family protein [Actinomycetia bacterium]|nr:GtrA family protein [Actinomycetes bacterium]